MSYFVYIIKNDKSHFYVGMSSMPEKRIGKHNAQSSTWTKHKGPWKLIHKE